MNAERVTPVDEFSGIPLPLSPQYMVDRPTRFRDDLHHSWHDRLNPLLRESLAGQALRHSRVQLANYDTHHLDYHRDNFDGPPIPTSYIGMLRPIVLAAAGYVPDRAISFNANHDAKLVPLTELQRARLWSSGKISVGQPAAVRNFLLDLTFQQDFSRLQESLIDEFLATSVKLRRRELGNRILKQVLYHAMEPVSPVYNTAYKSGLIPPDRAKTAGRFVLASLGAHQPGGNLYHMLIARLAAA